MQSPAHLDAVPVILNLQQLGSAILGRHAAGRQYSMHAGGREGTPASTSLDLSGPCIDAVLQHLFERVGWALRHRRQAAALLAAAALATELRCCSLGSR